MTTAYTSLLGLALPVTGELSGTWGDTVNNSITSLLDSAVAGTTNVSTDADVTLTTTSGAANTAREAILLFSGARTALRTITAPAQSKVYTVINATTGGYSVKLVGSGPTTGVTIVAGESAVCAWNGSDFVKVSNAGGSSSFVDLTVSGNLTLSGGTANGVLYLNGSKIATSGSALTFDGTTLLNSNGGFRVNSATSVSGAGIWGIDSALAFNVNSAEGMRLTSTGLGIGTSSPNYSLTSYKGGAVANYIQVSSGATGAGSGNGLLLGVDSSGNSVINAQGSGSGNILFYTATAEKMRLDTSGNLGLGVTPSAWKSGAKVFEVGNSGDSLGINYGAGLNITRNSYVNTSSVWTYGSTDYASRYAQNSGTHAWYTAPSGTAGNAITFTQAMTLDASGNLLVGTTSGNGTLTVSRSGNGNKGFFSNTTDADFAINCSSGVTLLSPTTGTLAFGTSSTERARIDSSGNFLVGITTLVSDSGGNYGVALRRLGSGASYTGRIEIGHGDSTGARLGAFYYGSTPTAIGSIDGTTTTTAYNTSSDYRLKNTIAPITGALAKVALLKPCTYKWNVDGSDGEGFIAHELAEVCPHAVTGEKDAVDEDGNPKYQGIDTSFLVATLTAALQEQQAIIETLTSRIAALEAKGA